VWQKIFEIVFRIIVCEGFINNTGYVAECRIVEDRVYRGVSPIKVANHRESMKPRLNNLREDITQFDFYYISANLLIYDVIRQSIEDGLFAIGSMAFIFCFMVYNNRKIIVKY
jgi:hypothetical protein